MDRAALLENLTQDILTYVMHGDFPADAFAGKIKPDELDERFEEYEKLVDLHFILQEDVVRFVRDLQKNLRNVKTQTKNASELYRGSVEGRINWQKTLQRRYASGGDSTIFVCDNRTEHYDIDENIVLKKLLSVIYNALDAWDDDLEKEYEWIENRWPDEEDLIEEMKDRFKRNVHINRIRDPKQYEPTDRMLARAESSRNELYREAARLLKVRQSLHNGDKDAIKSLLDNTAITPDDRETLLELYVLFRFIAALEQMRGGQFEMKTIRSGKQEVAKLVGEEKEIVLYHDNSAWKRGLSFNYDAEEDGGETLSRPEKVQAMTHDILANYFDEDTPRHSKRPDVIVLEIKDGDDYEYLVVEVKDSTRKKTIQEGVKEGLEYIAFLKQDDEFAFDEDNVFGDGYHGVLVTQDLAETKSLDDQEDMPLKILQASQLEGTAVLEDVLEDIVR